MTLCSIFYIALARRRCYRFPPIAFLAGVPVLVFVAGFLAVASASAAEPPEAPITEACSGPIVGGGQPVCGTLNPGASAKVGYYFAYNTGSDCKGGLQTGPNPEVEGQSVQVSDDLSGLLPDTKYSYCVVATNPFGEAFGGVLTFKVAAEPSTGGETPGLLPPSNALAPSDPLALTPTPAPAPAPKGCRALPERRRAKCRRLKKKAQKLAETVKKCRTLPEARQAKCKKQTRERYRQVHERYTGMTE